MPDRPTFTEKPPEDRSVAASYRISKAAQACAERDFGKMHELIHEAMELLREGPTGSGPTT